MIGLLIVVVAPVVAAIVTVTLAGNRQRKRNAAEPVKE